jgi:hypothetical protein
MTKKDYELIAEMIREARRETETTPMAAMEAIDNLTLGLSVALRQDNPRFDHVRFVAACKGEDSTDSAGRAVRYSRA